MRSTTLFCSDCHRVYGPEHPCCPLDGKPLKIIPADLPDVATVINGRYLILARMGVGGMGEIFHAHDIPLRREVALKVLKPTLAARDSAVQRFFVEARVARQLCHPNVVELFDFGVSREGYLYLAMELLPGITLADLLPRCGRLRAGEALLIARDVADALDHAHAAGLVHRDLKPENLFLVAGREPFKVKVLDFGVAAVAGSRARGGLHSGDVLGTPEYMSPEQVGGDAVDARSDIYSLGIVLYETLCGHPPFSAASPAEVMRMQLEEEPPPLPALAVSPPVRSDLESVLASMMARSPADRPATAREARDLIKGVMDLLATEDARAVDAALFRETLLPMRRVTSRFDDGAEGRAWGLPEGQAGGGDGMARDGAAEEFDPDTEPAGILGPRVPMPWTVGREEVAAAPRPDEAGQVITLLHIELDFNADREGILSLKNLFGPEMAAFQAEAMAREGVVLYDSGNEVRIAFGLYSRTNPPWISGTAVARDLLARAARFGANISVQVPIRIGIATDAVPTGVVHTTAPDLAVRGSHVDVAVRLARMALPGQAIVDETTRNLTLRDMSFEEVGRIRVRGRPKNSRVFGLVLAEAAAVAMNKGA